MNLLKLSLMALIAAQLTAVSASFADGPDSVTGLKSTMDDMGNQFTVIMNALLKHQPVAQADLQAAADKLLIDAKGAKPRLPDQLVDGSGAPLPEKQADIQQYNDIMDQLIAGVGKLDTAITAGDNATATTVLTGTILPIVKQGHGLFKPPQH